MNNNAPKADWRYDPPVWSSRGVQRFVASSDSTPGSARPRPADWAVYALIVFFSMVQEVGRTTLDTRVELAERPTSFLEGGFSLWHQSTNFGELLNQAYGYLFPQGPFFVLVELSGMPPWIGQRLWCALVVLVAFEGARRCARASTRVRARWRAWCSPSAHACWGPSA
jgi:hypothetical protein